MLLNAEIKDDHYVDLPRQQEAQYAYPAARYLKADASTGQSYIDLNAAAQSYSGPWLMGKQTIEASAGDITIDWHQSCLVPAGIADGVMIRGNVIYQNPDGTYRMSQDQFEGVLRSGPNYRFFEGQTQHTYHAANVPFGAVHLTGRLNTPLTQTLPYNPMIAIAGGAQGGGGDQAAATYAPYARTGTGRAHDSGNLRGLRLPDPTASFGRGATTSGPGLLTIWSLIVE
jgi:hypothetical protein